MHKKTQEKHLNKVQEQLQRWYKKTLIKVFDAFLARIPFDSVWFYFWLSSFEKDAHREMVCTFFRVVNTLAVQIVYEQSTTAIFNSSYSQTSFVGTLLSLIFIIRLRTLSSKCAMPIGHGFLMKGIHKSENLLSEIKPNNLKVLFKKSSSICN